MHKCASYRLAEWEDMEGYASGNHLLDNQEQQLVGLLSQKAPFPRCRGCVRGTFGCILTAEWPL